MFKKILIPVDFSSCSLQAYQYVTSLLARHDPQLHLFYSHPVHQKTKPNLPDQHFESLFEMGQFDLLMQETLKKTLGDFDMDKIEVSWEKSERKASQRILTRATETGADLIAMGTQGGGSLGKKVFGSTAANTLHNSDIPVLAIPEDAHLHGEVDRILFGCDFQKFSHQWMSRLMTFAGFYDAAITCLDINIAHNPLLEEKVDELKEKYGNDKITFQLIDDNNVVDGLVKYADQHQMDLIATHTTKMGVVERFIQRSYTDLLFKMSSTPVLALVGDATAVPAEPAS